MNKTLTIAQTLELAARTREHGIIPEFSFVLGGPDDPAAEIETTLQFIRRLKGINPAMELITYFYTPTPQRRGTYGDVDALAGTPETLEEWTEPQWVQWMTHEDPRVPWMDRGAARAGGGLPAGDGEPLSRRCTTRGRAAGARRWGASWRARRWARGDFENPALLRDRPPPGAASARTTRRRTATCARPPPCPRSRPWRGGRRHEGALGAGPAFDFR